MVTKTVWKWLCSIFKGTLTNMSSFLRLFATSLTNSWAGEFKMALRRSKLTKNLSKPTNEDLSSITDTSQYLLQLLHRMLNIWTWPNTIPSSICRDSRRKASTAKTLSLLKMALSITMRVWVTQKDTKSFLPEAPRQDKTPSPNLDAPLN